MLLRPSSTRPSTAIPSPGRIRSRSPTFTCSAGMSVWGEAACAERLRWQRSERSVPRANLGSRLLAPHPGSTLPSHLEDLVRESLRGQIAVPDGVFDSLYPAHVQRMSSVHWTPVEVALRAAALLAPEPGMRLLDVGAGPGKLCCIAALATGSIWQGSSVTRCWSDRERHGPDAGSRSPRAVHRRRHDQHHWADFDGLYFYNPFEAAMFRTRSTSSSRAPGSSRRSPRPRRGWRSCPRGRAS